MPAPDPLAFFSLKPVRAARVSEISETTAAAPVPPEERINFHIGNPLQDPQLSSAFVRIAAGLPFERADLGDDDPGALLAALGWPEEARPGLEFLIRTIQKSTPYLPRGGYARQAPNAVVKAFAAWLEQPPEPLHYDLGEQSGRREVILASGGVRETLRVILRALNDYLQVTPARVLCYRYEIRLPGGDFPNLALLPLPDEEAAACAQVEQLASQQPETPTFLVAGGLLSEATRRRLRLLSTRAALFFLEANNAPNPLSLAREARLVQRVLRLLTPGALAPHLDSLSPVFLAGNADFLAVIENVHFALKGTPSASEVELLSYLLEHGQAGSEPARPAGSPEAPPPRDGLPFPGGPPGAGAEAALAGLVDRLSDRLAGIVDRGAQRAGQALAALDERAAHLAGSGLAARRSGAGPVDAFAGLDARELLAQLAAHANDPEWRQALEQSFLSAFVQRQPQYRPEACLVASGSSRTALGLLGFHCGITEVVIPDLSWSYEQCFPTVHVAPLTEDLALDVDGIIARLQALCQADPRWPERGALALNNPHNATGRIFAPEAVERLIAWCLDRGITVIDDLAYQNVAPIDGLPEIPTARQAADRLAREGRLPAARADKLITVHSMSKTDCLAGARLAVVEIREPALRARFQALNAQVQPNLGAIFICYLFYRGPQEAVHAYWRLRNRLFAGRAQALLAACERLPAERNTFGLTILPPEGSMYPLLRVARLPAGLSLDWLASSLARRGAGLLPLATFARTEQGFDTGRSTFRLTLGGADPAPVLQAKTRRLLIDLNRLIAEEQARYNRQALPRRAGTAPPLPPDGRPARWEAAARGVRGYFDDERVFFPLESLPGLDRSAQNGRALQAEFLGAYLPERLEVFRTRALDRAALRLGQAQRALQDGDWLGARLERELMKDSLERRQARFRARSYDRTVHPTQRYSLAVELAFDALLEALEAPGPLPPALLQRAGQALLDEFLGRNVSINSQGEAAEILLDFDALTAAEDYTALYATAPLDPFLSFWSDWDGSNRPSGQGHRLIAAVVMENVRRMARLLDRLRQASPQAVIDPQLTAELERLPQHSRRFIRLLDDITGLTHQLEQRYQGILPFSVDAGPLQRLATRLRLRRDPARVLWQHNDRYERNMRDLRRQRREMLLAYFALNKRLRKQLHALIPAIRAGCAERGPGRLLLDEAAGYHDLLQRIVITPRIHQGLITARDPFAIDTTVHNLQEINAIAGQFGNPGMTLGLQISLASQPEALIALDRKLGMQAERVHRALPEVTLPSIWLIPLFEDLEAVRGIPAYLDRVWDYANQSRRTDQPPQERFTEIVAEIFIAGSDLSQQIGQAHGAFEYLQAKYHLQTWLAGHGTAEAVRVKLGSGEPMQRQGGYYSPVAGQAAFPDFKSHRRRLAAHLPAAALKSAAYAVTPLQGVFLGGDLRTFQSSLSEQLRALPVQELAGLLHHVRVSQQIHREDLVRAAETIAESRLGAQNRSIQELERLTVGVNEALYTGFLDELTAHFRHILYGRPEDVVGIHIISYFIGRSLPQLRDRPTSRRRPASGAGRGQQILANIAEIIPLARQGSLLRAIAHNQAQTAVLGVNQLTTGLFRALDYYAQKALPEAGRDGLIAERILPQLPVYEILHTLRLYQDCPGEFIRRVEPAFPAGNSAFVALREDSDARTRFLPLFQQELLRRHGLNVSDFLDGGVLIPELLPTLRPDLAVLLQGDLFNKDPERLAGAGHNGAGQEWRQEVARLLALPQEIRRWRAVIWEVMQESLYQRVQSFTELAGALYAFSATRAFGAAPAGRGARLPSALSGFIRTARVDDEMRQFLVGAVEYLSAFTAGSLEVPVSIIRALNDVERIALIEESALPPARQEALRFALLQIARLAGDNG